MKHTYFLRGGFFTIFSVLAQRFVLNCVLNNQQEQPIRFVIMGHVTFLIVDLTIFLTY